MPTTAPNPTAAPAVTLITVLHRAGGGQWRKVGTARTWAAALVLVDAGGDWWFREERDESDAAGPGLFDAVEVEA